MTIELGDKVIDKISGFAGIVTAKAKYLNGCTRILVEPTGLKESGEPIGAEWFDDIQVKVVGPSEFTSGEKVIGGPERPTPPSRDP